MGCKIKSIHIQNFKSLKDVKIELKDFNVFVGANGSGKSNIVEVFRFLKHINQPGVINPFLEYGGYRNLVWNGNENLPVIIKLEFEDENRKPVSYELAISGIMDVFKLEREAIISNDFRLINDRENLIFEYLGKKVGSDTILQSIKKQFFDNRTIFSSSIAVGLLSILRKSIDLKDKESDKITEAITLILKGCLFNSVHNFIPSNMKSSAKFESSESMQFSQLREYKTILDYDGKNLQMLLYEIYSKNKSEWPKEITNRLKILFPNIERMVPVPTPEGRVMLEVIENKNRFTPQSLSDGFFKIMAVLALSFGSRDSNILIIDEIENSLHPEAIEILIDALKSSKKQVIITTHSTLVLNMSKVEDILFVKKDADQTDVSRIKNAEKLKEKLEESGISTGEGWLYGLLP